MIFVPTKPAAHLISFQIQISHTKVRSYKTLKLESRSPGVAPLSRALRLRYGIDSPRFVWRCRTVALPNHLPPRPLFSRLSASTDRRLGMSLRKNTSQVRFFDTHRQLSTGSVLSQLLKFHDFPTKPNFFCTF